MGPSRGKNTWDFKGHSVYGSLFLLAGLFHVSLSSPHLSSPGCSWFKLQVFLITHRHEVVNRGSSLKSTQMTQLALLFMYFKLVQAELIHCLSDILAYVWVVQTYYGVWSKSFLVAAGDWFRSSFFMHGSAAVSGDTWQTYVGSWGSYHCTCSILYVVSHIDNFNREWKNISFT